MCEGIEGKASPGSHGTETRTKRGGEHSSGRITHAQAPGWEWVWRGTAGARAARGEPVADGGAGLRARGGGSWGLSWPLVGEPGTPGCV